MIPPSTVAIQTPTVVVDRNAESHCVSAIANAFVKYLHTPDAQDVFQSVGLQRPIDVATAQKGTDDEPPVEDLFTTDDLGGWDEIEKDTVFGPNGAFTLAFKAARARWRRPPSLVPESPNARARREPGAALGRWSLRGTAWLYLGVMILLPVAAILQAGFADGLRRCAARCRRSGRGTRSALTLIMAALTAMINGVLGTLLAYVLVRIPFPGRGLLSTIVDLPFAVPTLVAGVMLRALYGPNSAIGGFLGATACRSSSRRLGILLALLFVTLPLVVRTVQPVLLELDPAEEEAARVLGAGRWTTFRRVMFPALLPAIAGGCC